MKLVGFGWKSDAFTVRGWCHGRRQGAHVRAPLLEDLHAEPPGSRQKVSMYRGTPARPHGSAPGALPQIGKLGTQHGGPGQAPEPPVTTAYLSLGPEMLPPLRCVLSQCPSSVVTWSGQGVCGVRRA